MKAAQSWSQDGKTILFNADRANGLDLWTIEATPGATPAGFRGRRRRSMLWQVLAGRQLGGVRLDEGGQPEVSSGRSAD